MANDRLDDEGRDQAGHCEADARGNRGDEDDDDFEEVADEFEQSYNFRFEEALVLFFSIIRIAIFIIRPNIYFRGASTISRYPRHIPTAVRRPDTTRIEARERRKERKDAEKLQKKEEIKRMKALKKKELQEKLDRIG